MFFFSLASNALRACEARALRGRKTLTQRFTDFFTDFEEKKQLFCSLLNFNTNSNYYGLSLLWTLLHGLEVARIEGVVLPYKDLKAGRPQLM